MPREIKLGDKCNDAVSGFVGIATQRIECLNGCIRWLLAECKVEGEKNEFRTVEVDEQTVIKIDDGLNKKNPVEKTKTGGPTLMKSYLK